MRTKYIIGTLLMCITISVNGQNMERLHDELMDENVVKRLAEVGRVYKE